MPITQFEGKALVFNNGVVDVQQDGVSVVDENKIAHITPGEMSIDNLTIIKNADHELEVPFDNDTIYRDPNSGFIKATGGASEGYVDQEIEKVVVSVDQAIRSLNSEMAEVKDEISEFDFVSEGRLQEAIADINISDAKIILCTKVGDADASPVGSFTLNQDSNKTITIPIPEGGGSGGGLDSEGVRSLIKSDFGLSSDKHLYETGNTYQNIPWFDPNWLSASVIDFTDIVDSIYEGSTKVYPGATSHIYLRKRGDGSDDQMWSAEYRLQPTQNSSDPDYWATFSFSGPVVEGVPDYSTADLQIRKNNSTGHDYAININFKEKLREDYYDTNWARPLSGGYTSNMAFQVQSAGVDLPERTVTSNWNVMKVIIDQSDSTNNQLVIGDGSAEHEMYFKSYLSKIKNYFDQAGIMGNDTTQLPNFPLYLSHLTLSGDAHWAPWVCSPCTIKYDPQLGFEFYAVRAFAQTHVSAEVLKATFDGNTFTVTQWPATA